MGASSGRVCLFRSCDSFFPCLTSVIQLLRFSTALASLIASTCGLGQSTSQRRESEKASERERDRETERERERETKMKKKSSELSRRFRRLSAKIPQCACGYLAVVMKHPGLSVSFD